MTNPQIDPRHRPLRGVRAIAQYLGGQDEQIALRQIRRGLIDATPRRQGLRDCASPNRPVAADRRPLPICGDLAGENAPWHQQKPRRNADSHVAQRLLAAAMPRQAAGDG
jgi:hypothetical protein